ncbi:hypothetical protein SAMN04488065_0149 [Haloplanus vescus]|uniref:DUF7260 domain-containing protein n=1 Tax=Haloplanus vescus TaxID=555874 RepID=A0A1H3VRC6_9EURY|nr:hypothetical protein [Haloplanus vescus]SDZ76668.1 hypothetical protein SAMN04488065_0149 [Haloplanus vescus]
MTVTTHVAQAIERVRAERAAVERRRDAFETFAERVQGLSPEPSSTSVGVAAVAGTRRQASGDACRQVRTAFAETVRPHSVADADDAEPLLETIRAELSDTIAVALAPTTDSSFSPTLKRAILSEVATRKAENDLLDRALGRELAHLDDAREDIDDITGWIADADETPLLNLEFEALADRHETLDAHRDRCSTVARRRQQFLRETTSRGSEPGVGHWQVVSYLYSDFPVDHPLLATVARLDDACATCQRTVRDHLVRRV